MTKDEMKNRISMALTDPILQQGFEIICKENAELKRRVGGYLEGEQLIKAKEFIRKLSRLKHHTDDPFTYDEYLKLIKEVEQFLKDCDIDNAIQQANKELDFDKIADEMEQDLKDSEVRE